MSVPGGSRLIVGIDKGTTVTKAAVFDEAGTELSRAARFIQVLSPRRGWHEEDAEVSLRSTMDAVAEAVAALPGRAGDIAAVSVSGHMTGAWLLDDAGRPVRNAIAWPDARTLDTLTAFEAGPLYEEYLDISATSALPGMTMLLLGHLARHEPEVIARTRYFACAKDYVQAFLTGRVVTDPTDVSLMPGDIASGRISPRLMELTGAEAFLSRAPEVRPSGEIIGTVTREASLATGIPEGTPVANGLGDAISAMLGTGVVLPGQAVSVLGTSWLNQLVNSHLDDDLRGVGWVYPSPDGEHWIRCLAHTAGAGTFDWAVRTFCRDLTDGAGADFAAVEAEALASEEAGHGLTFLPYLSPAGVQAPFKDGNVRGVMLGLEHGSTRGDILRAVYEGQVYAALDCYRRQSDDLSLLRLTGGGARSRVWRQTFSNALQVPVELVTTSESAALGVAILASVSVGIWKDLETAVSAMVRTVGRVEPDPRMAEPHREAFERFVSAQAVARELFAGFGRAGIQGKD
ncbi:FGGY family carbohydrate kinase [Nonomuraea sp. MCN248]|uniref:FGGY family carbohydrate kinase n=1 Tax=Nonomuraea corallina TaxID=2989783 RepID=A0ABT4SNP2_9ACTN|nr:FGGY family carbohydrate kinase [Nonomuraea corallina]MDA0638640.1 FGGY family carbohydrate kinase [Nonomuraea corallina]